MIASGEHSEILKVDSKQMLRQSEFRTKCNGLRYVSAKILQCNRERVRNEI